MSTCLKSLAACTLFAAAAFAQAPVIGGLANNYSYIAAGLPNYGIAQGSIFALFGTNLVGTNLAGSSASQSPPLKTPLNGVTITVTVNGTATHPLAYYVTATVIGAILPSATPVGTGTITVTTGAGTSATFPIVVVQSAFGILTLNQAGTGMAASYNASNGHNLLGYTSAANPTDILELYGTGLGPVSGDETVYQTQTDFGTNLPIEVDIGGIPAQVIYHGRSAYPGLDQIDVAVPQNVAGGCSVSVVVLSKNNSFVSNAVTIPVAAGGGRTCSDASAGGLTTSVYQKCATSGCTIGDIGVGKTTTTTQAITVGTITIPGSTTTTDSISGAFYRYTPVQFATGIYGPSTVSIGSCTLYSFSYNGNNVPALPSGATPVPLNAGAVTATTPSTTTNLAYQSGLYSASSTTGGLVPASGGNFSFSNGGGGPDIGAFSGAHITLGAPLAWSSPPTSVTRSKGLTVNWTGGTAGTSVVLVGYSFSAVGASTTSFVGAFFWCSAPQSAGSLTVPATVLLALPATGSISESGFSIPLPGSLALSNAANPVAFTAPNLDYGYVSGSYTTSQTVTFQ